MAERPIPRSRWAAKKAARFAVAAAGRLSGGGGVRVLTYHRFGPCERMPFTVPAEQFEREMGLAGGRTGAPLSLADVEAHLEGRRRLPDGSALVTIDDGDPSVRTVALPILRRHGVPAVLYALAGRPEGFETLSEEELREVADGGVTIGSHTVSHRAMASLPRAVALGEARDSRRRLEDVLGREVTTFAYPFGTRRDVSPEAADLLAEAGYRTGFTSLHGAIRSAEPDARERLLLPRVKVESGDPSWLFPALCGGAMDRWRLVDDGLAGFQKPQAAAAA